MLKLDRDDLMDRLIKLDINAALLFDNNERLRLVIAGGGALILQQYIVRYTGDMDAISASPVLLSLLKEYNINCAVQTFINNFPYNFEDRLVLLFSGRKIDFFTASLEDIVIAKLYSIRPVDQGDVELDDIVNALDWDLLDRLATDEDEARASALNDRNYADFHANYIKYRKRFAPCRH